MTIKNPFENKDEASRYQKYRPMYHHLPLKQVEELLGKKIKKALDVACGTGHSTFALSKIADEVIGCDLSKTMLEEARKNYQIEFIQSKAEELPFKDASFDLINISMGFHWLDQEKFLKEASRLLKTDGHLVIDSYGFSGEISEDPKEQKAHSDLFNSSLPAASRRSAYPSSELLESSSFKIEKEISYDEKIEMSQDEFINLIKTWSNFQIKTSEDKKITSNKMDEVYKEIFKGEKLSLRFRGKALILVPE